MTRLARMGIHMKSTAAEHSHCVATCDSPWLTGVFMPIVRKGALEREAQRVLTRPVSISVCVPSAHASIAMPNAQHVPDAMRHRHRVSSCRLARAIVGAGTGCRASLTRPCPSIIRTSPSSPRFSHGRAPSSRSCSASRAITCFFAGTARSSGSRSIPTPVKKATGLTTG